jgi:hypothetical protein
MPSLWVYVYEEFSMSTRPAAKQMTDKPATGAPSDQSKPVAAESSDAPPAAVCEGKELPDSWGHWIDGNGNHWWIFGRPGKFMAQCLDPETGLPDDEIPSHRLQDLSQVTPGHWLKADSLPAPAGEPKKPMAMLEKLLDETSQMMEDWKASDPGKPSRNKCMTHALLQGWSCGEIESCKPSANPYIDTGFRWAWFTGFDLSRRFVQAGELERLRAELAEARASLIEANPLVFGKDGALDWSQPLPEIAKEFAAKCEHLRRLFQEESTRGEVLRATIASLEKRLAEAKENAKTHFQAARAWVALMNGVEAIRELDQIDELTSDQQKLDCYIQSWTKMKERAEAAEQRATAAEAELAKYRLPDAAPPGPQRGPASVEQIQAQS